MWYKNQRKSAKDTVRNALRYQKGLEKVHGWLLPIHNPKKVMHGESVTLWHKIYARDFLVPTSSRPYFR